MFKVTHNNNFCRVFELPESYPSGFLFGGGEYVGFKMVDWFNPIPSDDIENGLKEWVEYEKMLTDFWKRKEFYNQNRNYILITDFKKSIIF